MDVALTVLFRVPHLELGEQVTLLALAKELVHKVYLPFGCQHCGAGGVQYTAVARADTLLYIEKGILANILLVRDIVVLPFLAQIAILTQPSEQLLFAYLIAVLRD